MASTTGVTSSFTTTKVNSTTYAIREDDLWGERPIIYAKIHPKHPVIILNDTGCDEPSAKHKGDQITRLRQYLEEYEIDGKPLNPGGKRQYLIICTHCHFDHLNGITQFMPPSARGTAEVIASAAGRDSIETDLENHGLFKEVGRPVPYYQVTKWAGSFEALKYPIDHPSDDDEHFVTTSQDLGITIIHTPGHTPDSLAWYDEEDMHLYVGDSFYRDAAIIWPNEGNMIEWAVSMRKLQLFVESKNEQAAMVSKDVVGSERTDWEVVSKRVLVSCGHETVAVDGLEILDEVRQYFWAVLRKEIPVILSEEARGEIRDLYRSDDDRAMSMFAPRRLVDEARVFFRATERTIQSIDMDQMCDQHVKAEITDS